jgi:hypothetical protein
VLAGNWKYFTVLVLGYLIHWIPSAHKARLRRAVSTAPTWALFALALASTMVIYQILSAEVQPFIYFAF